MLTTSTSGQTQKHLNRVLGVDGALSIIGAVAGAFWAAHSLRHGATLEGGWLGVVDGAWLGALCANILVWGAVFLDGIWLGLRGKLVWNYPQTDSTRPETPVTASIAGGIAHHDDHRQVA